MGGSFALQQGRVNNLAKKRISFEEWLDREGVRNVADHLKIAPTRVWNWRALRSEPPFEMIRKMTALSKGAIDYASIIEREKVTKKHPWGGKRV